MGAMNQAAYADASAVSARAMEAIRELSYSTQLSSPADVSEVLASLEMTAEQLPVICGQLAAWLDDEAENAHLQASDGPFAGDVPAAVATAIQCLTETAELADHMRRASVVLALLLEAWSADLRGWCPVPPRDAQRLRRRKVPLSIVQGQLCAVPRPSSRRRKGPTTPPTRA
jgi:hypothetical protein